MKRVIDSIPTRTEDLFAAAIDWNVVDKAFVVTKIQPWIKKKITAFIGEEEPSLVEFIVGKLIAKSEAKYAAFIPLPTTLTTARALLQDLSVILDDEAESFVVKLWRLLLYELEAKNVGLPSQSTT
jgi:RNA-binding protein 25